MLRSTKILLTTGCLLAIALVSCPEAAQAKEGRTKTKTITPSKLLSVTGKSAKTLPKGQIALDLSNRDQQLAGTRANKQIVESKYCHAHRRPYCGYGNYACFGTGCDNPDVDGAGGSSDPVATQCETTVDDTASVADAN